MDVGNDSNSLSPTSLLLSLDHWEWEHKTGKEHFCKSPQRDTNIGFSYIKTQAIRISSSNIHLRFAISWKAKSLQTAKEIV